MYLPFYKQTKFAWEQSFISLPWVKSNLVTALTLSVICGSTTLFGKLQWHIVYWQQINIVNGNVTQLHAVTVSQYGTCPSPL